MSTENALKSDRIDESPIIRLLGLRRNAALPVCTQHWTSIMAEAIMVSVAA